MNMDLTLRPTKPPLKLGVFGLGRAFFSEHLPTLRKLKDKFELFAICDLDKSRRDRVETEFPDVRTYRQIPDMLDDADIDVFLVALPSKMHVPVTLQVLRRNRWCVTEQPIAFTKDEANLLRGAAIKTNTCLVPYVPGLYSPEFLLARQAVSDPRLGPVYDIRIRRQDYVRRDDWQALVRCCGGAVYRECLEPTIQALELLGHGPSQLWGELKRIASLGDAEDYLRLLLQAPNNRTADIEVNGGTLAPHEPAFTLRGERGTFTALAGCTEGTFHVVDPSFRFPRRRSSLKTPEVDEDLHENLPVVDLPLRLPQGMPLGPEAFWGAVHTAYRAEKEFPTSMETSVDAVRCLEIIKKSSSFAG